MARRRAAPAFPSTHALPPLWRNQLIRLYHGTLDVHVASILSGIDPSVGHAYTDFGQGFYTTTWESQAREWASELARATSASPVVVTFEVDRDALTSFDALWFVRGRYDADDYWSLVFHCRAGQPQHVRTRNQGWYDIVVGPVAASWRRRLAIPDYDQISFHTQRVCQVLDNSNPRRLP